MNKKKSMANKRFNATYEKGNSKIRVTVEVVTWSDDDVFHYYSPALDLVGYGYSDQEAKESFETVFSEFVDYTHSKGTIYDELERLGWTVNKRKKRVQPPSKEELMDDNEDYRNLMKRDDIRTLTKSELLAV